MEENREIKKPKVLIVHNYYQIPGGEDTVVSNEKRLLEDNGHEVFLYTRNNSELNEMGKLEKLLLPFITIFNFRTLRDVTKIIKNNGIDVVHVHNTLNLISPSVYYAALFCKTPVVQTMHNFRMLCPGATFYRDGKICEDCTEKGLGCAIKHSCYRNSKLQTLACVLNTLIHRATGIYKKINFICLTEFNKEKLLLLNKKRQVVEPSKIFVKPNFIDVREDFIIKKERENQFVFAGRMDLLKGIDVLLEAWEYMGRNAPKLVLCGTGPMEDWSKKYIQENDLNVDFKGLLSNAEIKKIIAESKAVILPTKWYEGFPMTIVEAFSVGTPVICSDFGNVATLIEDKCTGFLCKADSVESIAEMVVEVEQSNIVYEAVYDNYKEKFSGQVSYQRLSYIYQNVISRE